MIDRLLSELQETWDLNHYELDDIRNKMVEYALACQADSSVLEEAENLSNDIPNNIIYHYFGESHPTINTSSGPA